MEQKFRVCLNCGYGRGFHVYFQESAGNKIKIGLICPSCGQSYDIGWETSDVPGLGIRKSEKFNG